MNRQIVGFDIGTKSVKMAAYSGGTLRAAANVELPDNLIQDGKILSMDAMADYIRSAAKDNNIPFGNAAVVLPASEVFVRTVILPALSDQQMRLNLPYEFKDFLTENKAEYVFDYSVRGMVEQENAAPKMNVIACCVLRELVEQYKAMFRRAGYRLKVVVPAEVALGNVLTRYYRGQEKQDKGLCIVDLGHAGTSMYMFRGNEFVAKNTLGHGGAELDEVIAAEQGVDVHMAAVYKASNYNRVLNTSQCEETFRGAAVDIMKAVHFYDYNNRSEELEEIYLCGGGAAIEPLRRNLREMTGMPVKNAAELLGQKDTLSKSWQYLLACGAALNEV